MRSKICLKNLDKVDCFLERAIFLEKKGFDSLKHKSEYYYWESILRLYFFFYQEKDKYIQKRLKEIRRDYKRIFLKLIKNSYFNYKERLSFIVFFISPKLFAWRWIEARSHTKGDIND